MKDNMKTLMVNAVVLSLLSLSTTAEAADATTERCYGIVKAGQNDCPTNVSACKGTSTKDNQGDAYIDVPKGSCLKITGGSLVSTIPKDHK